MCVCVCVPSGIAHLCEVKSKKTKQDAWLRACVTVTTKFFSNTNKHTCKPRLHARITHLDAYAVSVLKQTRTLRPVKAILASLGTRPARFMILRTCPVTRGPVIKTFVNKRL